MASLADIVFDCAHPASLARFWAAVLDGYAVAPYEDAELARLASNGITDTEDDPTVLVESSTGGPRLWFQQVPEPKSAKNRVHLDVRATDRPQEIERLRALGAAVLDDQVDGLTVMCDPEANEFCVID
ncbi:MAG: VOC family protein [Acidimicrobiales bacterium]